MQLYEYDRELRICLLESLTEIEVAIRAIQYPRRPKGDNKPLKTKHELWIKRFNMVKDSSKEAFVEHHIKRYKGKMPIWAAVEIMDWGLRLKSNKIFAIIAITVYLSRMLGVSSGEHFPGLLKRFPRSTRAMEHTMGLPTQWEKYLEIAPCP